MLTCSHGRRFSMTIVHGAQDGPNAKFSHLIKDPQPVAILECRMKKSQPVGYCFMITRPLDREYTELTALALALAWPVYQTSRTTCIAHVIVLHKLHAAELCSKSDNRIARVVVTGNTW